MNSKLAEVFDVEPHEIVMSPPPTMDVVPVVETGENVEDVDFNAARANTYELIDMSKAAMHTAMKVAAGSENPRALEVVGQLLTAAASLNKQLIVMSKDRADVKTAKGTKTMQPTQQIGNVQQAVFVGSSSDLNKLLAEKLGK